MKHLGIDEGDLKRYDAINTAAEIEGQPELWMKTWEKIAAESAAIGSFLSDTLPRVNRIILTGAGTSAFIGLSLKGSFQKATGKITEAIPTTDIVSHPEDLFLRDIPTLLISFARSGNSPESVAAVSLADKYIDTCFHLFITCDPDGKLARHKTHRASYVFLMPAEANDKSLAMTGSYSSMLLAGIMIAGIRSIHQHQKLVTSLADTGRRFITSRLDIIRKIAEADFDRAVFLGSGPLYGVAKESHLKLQELTDGKVICKYDSFLGFRHGPKAVTNARTLIFYLLSSSEHVRKYETDLIRSMDKGQPALMEACVSESRIDGLPLDHYLCFSDEEAKLTDELFAVACILPAQLLGFFKCLNLGLKPDAPSASGAISRVVEGVNIYEEF